MVNVSLRPFIIFSRLPKVVRNDVAQNITVPSVLGNHVCHTELSLI